MEKSEEYYRLGIRYANKLIKAVFSENPKKELANLIQKERTRNNELLVWKEFCHFMFGVSTMLIGLNKELIEESGINSSYEYDINSKLKANSNMQNIFSTKSVCILCATYFHLIRLIKIYDYFFTFLNKG